MKKNKTIIFITALFLSFSMLIMMLLSLINVDIITNIFTNNNNSTINTIIVIICSLIGASIGTIIFAYSLNDDKKSSDNIYTEYLAEKLNHSKDNSNNNSSNFKIVHNNKEISFSAENENPNIIALMLKNAQEITEYFSISKSQAKISFALSVISCALGLFFLLASIVMAIYNQNITATIISAISGAIAELIAATVFWVHNKSALQLNRYYTALHENEKFLSAINLVNEITESKRDDVFIRIINQQLNIKENTEDK